MIKLHDIAIVYFSEKVEMPNLDIVKGYALPYFCLKLTIIHCLQSWPHPLNWVRTCVRLLFEGGYYYHIFTLFGSYHLLAHTIIQLA